MGDDGGDVEDWVVTAALEEILADADLDTTSVRTVMQWLQQRFPSSNLRERKKFIKGQIESIIDRIYAERNEEGDDDEDDEDVKIEEIEEEDEEEEVEEESEEVAGDRKRRKAPARVKVKRRTTEEPVAKRPRALKPFQRAVVLKPPLAALFGTRITSRCKIPTHLKEYIASNELEKNPADRREYLCDSRMEAVLEVKTFSMFSFNRFVSHLIVKPDECDEKTQYEAQQWEAAALEALPPEGDETKAAKKTKAKQAKSEGREVKTTGLHKPMKLSAELAEICGSNVLARTEVVKMLWLYIRENNLKDPSDGRIIICDSKFRAICSGADSVTMFALQKYITNHLTAP